jgi:hypothetical protein
MPDKRTEFQRFTDFMKAIVKVPKSEIVTSSRKRNKASKKPTIPATAKK